jgi:myo-inositol-1(or 4)-monophosphatase
MADEKMKETALQAAKEAGKILKDGLGRIHEISHKREIDLVTEIDHLSEERIIRIIRKEYPDHEILAEEGGKRKGSSSYRWIIDPLDGTTNYAHGYPCFCISIALEENGEVTYGVVYDPTREELFIAEKGKGAKLNGKPISVSQTEKLTNSLLCTGFPYDIREGKETNLDNFQTFMMKAQAVRRDGAAALDLCYVAAGRFDGYWELKLSPWDVAAGSLMVTEAEGTVTDFEGRDFTLSSPKILASNGRIHQEMVEVLKGGRN